MESEADVVREKIAAASQAPEPATPVSGDSIHLAKPSEAALALIRPMVEDRSHAYAEMLDSAGRKGGGESAFTARYVTRLDSLLDRRDALGDEALAAAWRIYFGEAYGELITCEIVSRGSRMLPLIQRFGPQSATSWFPNLPPDLAHDTTFTPELVDRLRAGSPCDTAEYS